jgi:hypothetical protein
MIRLQILWRTVLLALALAPAIQAQTITIYHPTTPDPREFPVAAWGGSPSDPELLRDMKEAGFTVSGFCRSEDLDKVQAAGLRCFVTDPRISLTPEQWSKLPPEEQLRKGIVELVREVGNHPAALGYFLCDEPYYSSMMANLGKVAAILRELAPDKLPYVNLCNSYCSQRRFQPVGYEGYVRSLAEVIHQPFISYDCYALVNGEMMDRFYTQLEWIRRIGLETKTPFWNIVLSNSFQMFMEPTDATVHLQAYATMAYGGRGIVWFTYMGYPDMRLSAIDTFGHKTPTWGMLQRINSEVQMLAPTLLKLRSTGVYHYPDVPERGKPLAESKLVKTVELTQDWYRPPTTVGRILIGELEDSEGRPYLMVVNKDLKNPYHFHLELKQPERKIYAISSFTGQEDPSGPDDWLPPGSGKLLRVE